MLNLRIVRSPLAARENEVILRRYNDLTSSRIPSDEFLHWVQDSPAGPAWHGILETENGEIAGHTCLLPLRASYQGNQVVAAKAEYSFVLESARAETIRDVGKSARPKFIVMTDELFRHCRTEGWGPFLMFPPPHMLRFAGSVGCASVEFPFTECLLVLRPWEAARRTPNLGSGRRAALRLVAAVQRPPWTIAAKFFSGNSNGSAATVVQNRKTPEGDRLSFFHDRESHAWRYLQGQYETLVCDTECAGSVTVKNGSAERYLRICQYEMGSPPSFTLVAKMVRMALKERALGVRWAVYGNNATAGALVRRLRSLGFLCVRRARKLMIYANWPDLLHAANWDLHDSIFSFDP